MSYLTINSELVAAKLGCFLSNWSLGSVAILNVFFVSVGMSELRAGVLTAMINTPCIIAGPMWGYLADYTKRRTLILLVLCTGAAGSIFVIPWSAYILLQTDHCNSTTANVTDACPSSNEHTESVLFFVLLFIMIVASVFVSPQMAYFQAIVATVAKGLHAPFGTQRIFGEIGISSSIMFTGFVCQNVRIKGMSEYTPAFIIFPVVSLLMIPVGWRLIQQVESGGFLNQHLNTSEQPETEAPLKYSQENVTTSSNRVSVTNTHAAKCAERQTNNHLFKKALHLCRTPSVIFFLCTVLMGGIPNALYISFTFKYLVENMGLSKSESSYVFACSSVSSCLTFIWAHRCIQTFRGTLPSMAVSLFATFVRLLLISFNIPYSVFLMAHLLNGFSFALFYCATMNHLLDISPPGILMTMNQLTLAIFFYVSMIVANIGGSEVYQMYGGRMLFRGQSFVCAVWLLVLLVYIRLTNVRSKRNCN